MKPAILTTFLLFAILTGGGRVPLSLASAPSAIPSTEMTPGRDLGEAELKELLTTVLQRDHVQDKGDLKLRFTRSWQPVTVSHEPITLKVLQLPTAGVSSDFIVRFELSTPTRHSRTRSFAESWDSCVWRCRWTLPRMVSAGPTGQGATHGPHRAGSSTAKGARGRRR